MSIWSWLFRRRREEREKKYITAISLASILNKILNIEDLKIADENYYLAPLSDYKRIVQESLVNQLKYISEKHDCDDFAFLLKADFIKDAYRDGSRRPAYCFGIIWGMLPHPHAMNWCLDETEKLWLIEPQTDEFMEFNKENIKEAWLIIL